MFTGIVEALVPCTELRRGDSGLEFWIDFAEFIEGAQLGDSVAVNGCCLTIEAFDGSRIRFHAGQETLDLTNLGTIREGELVNVERALRLGDQIGGHLVSGHVDGVGSVIAVEPEPSQTRVVFRLPKGGGREVLKKGSITLDGVSLTITEIKGDEVAVALIPHTLEVTKMGRCQVGDPINVEYDQMGKWVRTLVDQALESRLDTLLAEKLRDLGKA